MQDIFQTDHTSEYQIKERSGAMSIAELLDSSKHIITNPDNGDHPRGMILDFRKAWLNSDLKEVVKTCNLCKKHPDFFPKYNIAVVTSDPRIVASTILVRQDGEHFSVKPFSTIEGAKNWIFFNM